MYMYRWETMNWLDHGNPVVKGGSGLIVWLCDYHLCYVWFSDEEKSDIITKEELASIATPGPLTEVPTKETPSDDPQTPTTPQPSVEGEAGNTVTNDEEDLPDPVSTDEGPAGETNEDYSEVTSPKPNESDDIVPTERVATEGGATEGGATVEIVTEGGGSPSVQSVPSVSTMWSTIIMMQRNVTSLRDIVSVQRGIVLVRVCEYIDCNCRLNWTFNWRVSKRMLRGYQLFLPPSRGREKVSVCACCQLIKLSSYDNCIALRILCWSNIKVYNDDTAQISHLMRTLCSYVW